MLDTEISYLDGIQTIIDRLYNPLRFYLQSSDFLTIFINIFEILGLHRKFLPELTEAILKCLGLVKEDGDEVLDKNWVAQVFFKFVFEFLKKSPQNFVRKIFADFSKKFFEI